MEACACRPERLGFLLLNGIDDAARGLLRKIGTAQTEKPERALRAFRRAQPVRSIVTIPEPGEPGASKVGGFYAREAIRSRVAGSVT